MNEMLSQEVGYIIHMDCNYRSKSQFQRRLTIKRLGHFFSKRNIIFYCVHYKCKIFYTKLVQYNEFLITIVGADDLVL